MNLNYNDRTHRQHRHMSLQTESKHVKMFQDVSSFSWFHAHRLRDLWNQGSHDRTAACDPPIVLVSASLALLTARVRSGFSDWPNGCVAVRCNPHRVPNIPAYGYL